DVGACARRNDHVDTDAQWRIDPMGLPWRRRAWWRERLPVSLPLNEVNPPAWVLLPVERFNGPPRGGPFYLLVGDHGHPRIANCGHDQRFEIEVGDTMPIKRPVVAVIL